MVHDSVEKTLIQKQSVELNVLLRKESTFTWYKALKEIGEGSCNIVSGNDSLDF